MSYIDGIDPEVAHAINDNPAERYIAIGEDPPKAREMTIAVNLEMRANLPPTDVTIEETTIPRTRLRNTHCHLPATRSRAARGTALDAWWRLHRRGSS